MKITEIEAWPVTLKLQEPYTIAYQTTSSVVNIFLRIETDRGIIGYGCAAPDEQVTGENEQSVLQTMNDVIIPGLKGEDALRATMLLEKLKRAVGKQPSALAAVDLALHDILGKTAGLPLWRLLGGFRDRMKTSVTIGIMSEEETVNRAKEWIAQGFQCLKIKGGRNVKSDIARVIKVREAVGRDIEIRFDANQGYTINQTLYFMKQTKNAKLEFIEQPTPRDDLEALKYLTTHGSLPVMADESILNLYAAFQVARYNLANLVNIKLMKSGGIGEAIQISAVARAGGVDAMVGCMDESALSIAAGLHVALAQPNVIYADLDGHIGLEPDPFAGAVILKDGYLFPKDEPGLGVERLADSA